MRVRIQHEQQSDLFFFCNQLLRHFERDQATERESDEEIGSVRLYLLDGIQRVSRHVFDTIQRFFYSVNALRLHAVNRARCLYMLHHLEKIHDAAAQSVRNKNRRLFGAGLQSNQWGDARRGRLLQQPSQRGNRRRMIDHHGRQFAPAC